MKKLLIILTIVTITIITLTLKQKDKEAVYLDNIENALVAYYTNKNYIYYLEKAYNTKAQDELLYEIIMTEFDKEAQEHFYNNKKDKALGYEYIVSEEFEKAYELKNEIATRILFENYYYNFEFDKALQILENGNISKNSYIIKEFLENKEEFLDMMRIYKNIYNKESNDYEKNIFKKFILKYKNNYEKAYKLFRYEVDITDAQVLYIKYLYQKSKNRKSDRLLNKLVELNFPLAISEYIKNNKIYIVDEKLQEKIDKYAIEAQVDLFINYIKVADIHKLEENIDSLPNTRKTKKAIADFYYNYMTREEAYNKYFEALEVGYDIDDIITKLVKLSKKLNKEEEVLAKLNIYEAKYNMDYQKLRYERAKTNLEKKRIALEMWKIDARISSSFLLTLSNNKNNINFYTNILK